MRMRWPIPTCQGAGAIPAKPEFVGTRRTKPSAPGTDGQPSAGAAAIIVGLAAGAPSIDAIPFQWVVAQARLQRDE